MIDTIIAQDLLPLSQPRTRVTLVARVQKQIEAHVLQAIKLQESEKITPIKISKGTLYSYAQEQNINLDRLIRALRTKEILTYGYIDEHNNYTFHSKYIKKIIKKYKYKINKKRKIETPSEEEKSARIKISNETALIALIEKYRDFIKRKISPQKDPLTPLQEDTLISLMMVANDHQCLQCPITSTTAQQKLRACRPNSKTKYDSKNFDTLIGKQYCHKTKDPESPRCNLYHLNKSLCEKIKNSDLYEDFKGCNRDHNTASSTTKILTTLAANTDTKDDGKELNADYLISRCNSLSQETSQINLTNEEKKRFSVVLKHATDLLWYIAPDDKEYEQYLDRLPKLTTQSL